MAYKYGNPVKFDTLKAGLAAAEDKKTDDQILDMASKQAYDAINAGNETTEGKSFEAASLLRAQGMKDEYGNGVSTLIMFYNATGHTLKFKELLSDSGKLFKYRPPRVLFNGEWGCFLHTKKAWGATGSVGHFGYTAHDGYDPSVMSTFKVVNMEIPTLSQRHLVVAWSTPYSGSNSAWADMSLTTSDYAIHRESYYSYADEGKNDQMRTSGKYQVHQQISNNSSPILRVVAARKGVL